MKLELDETDIEKIEATVLDKILDAVTVAIKKSNDDQPYLTRAGIARYMGVGADTISHWANELGMPYVQLEDGRKMYGKRSCTNWLKSKEVTLKQEQTKSPRLLEQS